MKYNSFVNLFLVKLTSSLHYNATMYYTCVYIHYNAGAGYTEVALKNQGNNGLTILHGNMNSNFFINPLSSDAYRPHDTL